MHQILKYPWVCGQRLKTMKQYKRALTIAGSDSGGGAGIQADLKAFSACGCFGMSAITAITAQNTCGVTAIHPVPVEILIAQIRAVLDDIGVDVIKIGMLHSAEVIDAVVDVLMEYGITNVVLDPVMVATSGDPLIQDDAIAVMRERLFPLVRLITPNVPEAEILLGEKVAGNSLAEIAHRLARKFSVSVLAKAGHLHGEQVVDVLYDWENKSVVDFVNPRISTQNSHGTGCTLSSAIAAHLIGDTTLVDAVSAGIDYVHGALRAGAIYQIGKGHGPVHHFYNFW